MCLQSVVRSAMAQAVATDPRVGTSVLRLFFHDCFVNGCDSSVEHDDAPGLTGEKGAGPNLGSLHGFEAVDTVKARVEAACNTTVSCADVLTLASRGAVSLLGGPTWTVKLGRKDARAASQAPNANLPGPGASLALQPPSFAAPLRRGWAWGRSRGGALPNVQLGGWPALKQRGARCCCDRMDSLLPPFSLFNYFSSLPTTRTASL
ncbi:hypothetical protein ACQ4PT_016748 [Festuca glaucescens]